MAEEKTTEPTEPTDATAVIDEADKPAWWENRWVIGIALLILGLLLLSEEMRPQEQTRPYSRDPNLRAIEQMDDDLWRSINR